MKINFDLLNITIKSPHEDYIRRYITSEKNIARNRIPLLVGTTAVAKSSLIKSIVKELESEGDYGYRLVDIRTAFLDKNDIEGFTTKVRGKNNEYQIEMSPMRELLECTDEFLSYARATLKRLLELSKKNGKDDTLDKLIEIYSYKSKTPVLFFDEITRAEKSVRNAFTTIINQKQFLDYHISIAKIVAATNYAVDMPEEYSLVYTTEDITDIASLERYETYVVRPVDVFHSWLEWAENNIHPVVLKFIKTYGSEYAYNSEVLVKSFNSIENADPMSISEYPFPNYRSWEHVSMYIKSREGATVSKTVIQALLGDNKISVEFINYLGVEGVPVYLYEREDYFYEDMKECVLAGVPVMLAGPTSYGKTTRVSNLADELDAVLISINLATKDSTQIKGVPYPLPIEDAILKGYDIEDIPDELLDIIKDTGPHKLSVRTTEYIPDKYVREKLLEARENNKRVILFYDEVNRCDKTVLSSVFEAVSDHRAFGVDIDKEDLSIVCAANLGESYGDVTDLDPAFSSRFAVIRRDKWTLEDVESFKTYMEDKNYHESITRFINDLRDTVVLDMLESTKNRTLVDTVPSMRAWDDMSTYINNSEETDPIRGSVVFAINNQIIESEEKLKSIIPDNWIGYLQDVKVTDESGNVLDMREVVKSVDEDSFVNTVRLLSQVEDLALQTRYAIIKSKLGPNKYSEQFFDYYNIVSGRALLDIRMVERVEDIPEYISSSLYGVDVDQLPSRCSVLVRDIMLKYEATLPEENYKSILTSINDTIKVKDIILKWWYKELRDQSEPFKQLVTLASQNDKDFTYKILDDLGLPSGKYQNIIENYYSERGTTENGDVSNCEESKEVVHENSK